MARAMRASGLGKPNATRVRTRIFVLVGSTIRPQLVEEHAHSGLVQALSRPDAAQINQRESSSTTALKYRLPRLTVRQATRINSRTALLEAAHRQQTTVSSKAYACPAP